MKNHSPERIIEYASEFAEYAEEFARYLAGVPRSDSTSYIGYTMRASSRAKLAAKYTKELIGYITDWHAKQPTEGPENAEPRCNQDSGTNPSTN